MSSDQLMLIGTLTINDGAVEAFTDLVDQCCGEVAANEPGALSYDAYVDGNVCRWVEVYENSAALIQHVSGKVVTELMPQLLGHASLDSILAFGDPTPEARGILEQFQARILGRPTRSSAAYGTAR